MVDKARIKGLIAQIDAALDEPAPVRKDAFGAVEVPRGAIRAAKAMSETKKFLEELLADEDDRPEKAPLGLTGPAE